MNVLEEIKKIVSPTSHLIISLQSCSVDDQSKLLKSVEKKEDLVALCQKHVNPLELHSFSQDLTSAHSTPDVLSKPDVEESKEDEDLFKDI